MNPPTCHSFTTAVDRPPAEHEWDWLGDAASDAEWTLPADGTAAYAEFDRTGRDLAEAIGSAIADLNTAGFRAVEVRPVELLRDTEVADRVGMSVGEIDALVGRSPAIHPRPMLDGTGHLLWSEVSAWLAAHGVPQSYDQTIWAANQLLKSSVGTRYDDDHKIAGLIRRAVRRANPWQMPPEVEPYRSFIADTGGNAVETLVDRLDLEPRLSTTNLPVFVLAMRVHAQVELLRRLYADGCLPPAPNGDGGWGR